jgi:hypothetical protein
VLGTNKFVANEEKEQMVKADHLQRMRLAVVYCSRRSMSSADVDTTCLAVTSFSVPFHSCLDLVGFEILPPSIKK